MKELQFQSALVDAANAAGGHAFKMNNRFKRGVADVYIRLPSIGGGFIECKWGPMHPLEWYHGRTLPARLTPLQWRFLDKEAKAGGTAGWVYGAPMPGGRTIIVAGHPRNAIIQLRSDNHWVREKGEKWPVIKVMEYLSATGYSSGGI